MTTFTLYDAERRIHQSNKVYDPTGYEGRLREAGHERILVTDHAKPLHPDEWYIADNELTERPDLPVTVSKTLIQAGGVDGAKIQGPFEGAKVTVQTSNMVIFENLVNGNTIDVSIPVPCIYQITIDKWPFKPLTIHITAEE